MPTQTLLQRAKAFAAGPAAALAAIVPLAAAPAANATILVDYADVTTSFLQPAIDSTVEYFGSPLEVVPGTNNSNAVRLSGFGDQSVRRPFSGAGQLVQTQLAYFNGGVIDAQAGDVFAIAYSFSLNPDVSIFGLPTDVAWSITAFVAEVFDGSPGVVRTGGATGVAPGATLDFTGSFDVASFAADTTAFLDLVFEIVWSIPAAPSGTETTFGSLLVDVPANSIDLLLLSEIPPEAVPEPAMPALMLAGLAGLLAARRRQPVRA